MNKFILDKYECLITEYCMKSESTNPLKMAYDIMQLEYTRMHGPEHHYVTAAVLITAYCNERKILLEKEALLKKVFYRTDMIQAGTCGFYGVCGDVQAVGAAVSLLLKATPYSGLEVKLVNKITAKCQEKMAYFEGPRCCKRATFLNVSEAANCMNEIIGTSLKIERSVICDFSPKNETCAKCKCPFYKRNK